jgi:hypothetical protein
MKICENPNRMKIRMITLFFTKLWDERISNRQTNKERSTNF